MDFPFPLASTCQFESDWAANGLATVLILGLFVSYLPQHLRIIRAGTSVGFSPWFLLLGSTSSAAAVLNIFTLQWPIIRCCTQVSLGTCLEQTAGMLQVGVQWFLFAMIVVLYMLYYPPNLKYIHLEIDTHDSRPIHHVRTKLKSSEWRLSIIVTWLVCVHLAICFVTTVVLLADYPPSPDSTMPRPPQITLWAAFLGVTSGLLAAVQYAPQIIRTYNLKLVGALSMPMMVIQSPGGIVMAISIAMRPGTDWTSWLMYAVSAVMQACLLIMCVAWKFRQRRLGIDDFGRPLGEGAEQSSEETTPTVAPEEDGVSIIIEGEGGGEAVGEDTPLLKPGSVVHRGGVLGWIQRLGK